jgi:hypothetical protein
MSHDPKKDAIKKSEKKNSPAITTGITDLMINLGSRTPIVMMPTPALAVP